MISLRDYFRDPEDAIADVCEGCKVANLDYSGKEFCDIQALVGFGEEVTKEWSFENGNIVCSKYMSEGPLDGQLTIGEVGQE
ncbi:MAG: hypothetical protein HGA54_00870 [Actinobacteria bacterium]|nr:hypothetical protein [Actinomycetota bacterium]